MIVPAGKAWDSFFLNGPVVREDFMTERGSQCQEEIQQPLPKVRRTSDLVQSTPLVSSTFTLFRVDKAPP